MPGGKVALFTSCSKTLPDDVSIALKTPRDNASRLQQSLLATPMLGPFRARRHEKRCRRFFNRHFVVPEQVDPIKTPINIMVFVNRSGSSLLSQYLEATGKFSAFGEPLSAEMIIERSGAAGFSSFEAYLRGLYAEIHSQGRQVGLKASLDQVLMLLRSHAIPRLFPSARWIFLERLDIVAQAISFCIATQTGTYYSDQEVRGAAPLYNFRAISRRARLLSRNYADCRLLLSSCAIQPYHLTYERFILQPEEETRKLAAFLGEQAVTIDTAAVRLDKQSDHINEAFRERFVQDMSARLHVLR